MKPSPFDYVAATSLDHALELLASDRDAKVLAGGQSLMPVLNLRLGAPDLVVDIGRIPELRSIEVVEEASPRVLRLGAAVTQSEAGAHPEVAERWPMLAAAIGCIGHPPIRNRGTVCGSLAHNDPQAELPAVALALNASMIASSPRGRRSLGAHEFFNGPFDTALDDDELLIAVEFPEPPPGQGWSFREFMPRPGDFATAGVAAVVHRSARRTTSRVVSFALGGGPTRASVIEGALADATGPELAPAVLDRWAAELMPGEVGGSSGESRVRQARLLVSEAIAEAWERMS